MAIRLRKVEGQLVALCAYETDSVEGDVYLDDDAHYALSLKFARENNLWYDEVDQRLADSQKLRDASTRHDLCDCGASSLAKPGVSAEARVTQEQVDEAEAEMKALYAKADAAAERYSRLLERLLDQYAEEYWNERN